MRGPRQLSSQCGPGKPAGWARRVYRVSYAPVPGKDHGAERGRLVGVKQVPAKT